MTRPRKIRPLRMDNLTSPDQRATSTPPRRSSLAALPPRADLSAGFPRSTTRAARQLHRDAIARDRVRPSQQKLPDFRSPRLFIYYNSASSGTVAPTAAR